MATPRKFAPPGVGHLPSPDPFRRRSPARMEARQEPAAPHAGLDARCCSTPRTAPLVRPDRVRRANEGSPITACPSSPRQGVSRAPRRTGRSAAVITISGSSSEYAWLEELAPALMVSAPIAVGLYARRRPPTERFGTLLILAGFCWFLTTLSETVESCRLQHRARGRHDAISAARLQRRTRGGGLDPAGPAHNALHG